MKKIIFSILCALITTSPLLSQEYVATLKKVPTKLEIKNLATRYNITNMQEFFPKAKGIFAQRFNITIAKDYLEKLKSDPLVDYIEEIYQAEMQTIVPSVIDNPTDDTFFNYQWGLHSSGQTLFIEETDIKNQEIMAQAGIDIDWIRVKDSLKKKLTKEIIVAVIDSGIDIAHEDLADNIFRNEKECTNGKNLPPTSAKDMDENGFRGDCMGWNFTGKGDNQVYDEKVVNNGRPHGTHVAGIIAAVQDNQKGISGIAPNVKILPIKILSGPNTTNSMAFTDRIAKGILYAVQMNAKLINMSMGWPLAIQAQYLLDAIKVAQDAGVVIIAAAGNNGINKPLLPCGLKNVVCVGAVTADGSLASFSNYGPHVDFLAPGDEILSTYPMLEIAPNFPSSGYAIKKGTSQAAPFVTGAYAVLSSYFENITPDEIYARLYLSSLKDIESSNSIGGIIQLAKALEISPKALVLPVIKEHSTVIIKEDNTFTLPITIKNYLPTKSNTVTVSLNATSSKMNLFKKTITINSLLPHESLDLNFAGEVLAKNIEAEQDFSITITDSKNEQIFHFTPILALDSSTIPGKIWSLDVLGTDAKKIRTVTDKYSILKRPQYFLSTKGKETSTLKIISLKEEGNLQIISKNFDMPIDIVSVFAIDLNFDKQQDYLIAARFMDETKKGLYFYYLDKDLNPINKLPPFFYQGLNVPFNIATASFVPFIINNKKIAVPLFLAQSYLPQEDREQNPWSTKDDSEYGLHLFYLLPDLENKNFNLRAIDSFTNQEQFKDALNLSWSDSLNILHLGYQSKSDLLKGRAFVWFNAQCGAQFVDSLLTIDGISKFKIIKKEQQSLLTAGSNLVPLHDISGREINFFENSILSFAQNETINKQIIFAKDDPLKPYAKIHYTHNKAKDTLAGSRPGFITNDGISYFIESKDHLILINQSKYGQNFVDMRSINRVSFLNGATFSEMLYPVVAIDDNNVKHPAIYVDDTAILTGHIYVMKIKNNKIVLELGNNLHLDSSTMALNPMLYDGKQHMILLETKGKSYALKLVPIK